MENQKVKVFLGLMGSGKDYNAEPFIQAGYKHVAFADALRNILYETLGYRPENYEKFKISDVRLGFLRKISTGRKLLQNLGTALRKYIDKDIWVNTLIKNIVNTPKVVITDCRFDNEVSKLIKYAEKTGCDISFVWCCYKSKKYEQGLKEKHESEALAQYITNNCDFKDQEEISINDLKYIIKEYRKYKNSISYTNKYKSN